MKLFSLLFLSEYNYLFGYWCTVLQSRLALSLQFMDLRTRYTALVTLTTQHVKYISDALRRLEEEEVRLRFSFTISLTLIISVLSYVNINIALF